MFLRCTIVVALAAFVLTGFSTTSADNPSSSPISSSAAAVTWSESAAPALAQPVRPNIVLVLTDDMTRADLHSMPGVNRVLTGQGRRFTRAMVNVSLCCPSRTTILRGQYSHNTGVLTNGGNNGGFEHAYQRKVERSTIATWLQRAGYRTALIGKYLNGYPNGAPPGYQPPGWTDWVSPIKGSPYDEYGYRLDVNGHHEDHFQSDADYGTNVYFRHARRFIAASQRAHRPFFLDLALYAPHRPATPAPQDVGSKAGIRLPRTPSFDERDLRDKPRWLQDQPRLNRGEIARTRQLFQNRRESLRAVDRGVVRLVDQLAQTNQLDHTYIVFTSDNGFHQGQHRLPAGKQTAFEEDIRVPLVVRGPGVGVRTIDSSLVGNVDLAPTFAALAGVKAPKFVDGRSLVGELRGGRDSHPRQMWLLEHWRKHGPLLRDSQLPLEPPDNDETEPIPVRRPRHPGISDQEHLPNYRGFRTEHMTYVEYVTGERELYDLRIDPNQLDNEYSRSTIGTRRRFHRALRSLAACSARRCRSVESRSPGPIRWRRGRAPVPPVRLRGHGAAPRP